MEAFLVCFGPIFFEFVEVTVDQRLHFVNVGSLEGAVPHANNLIQVLLVSLVQIEAVGLQILGTGIVIAVIMTQHKLFPSSSLLNPIHQIRIMHSNVFRQLLLEFFVRGTIFLSS